VYIDDKGDNFDAAALQLAEYYTAIVSPNMARMLRRLLMTKIALFEAKATYEALNRVPTTHLAPSLIEQPLEAMGCFLQPSCYTSRFSEAHMDVKSFI
jgi:hypothetical protein